jgi:hypothetical protein
MGTVLKVIGALAIVVGTNVATYVYTKRKVEEAYDEAEAEAEKERQTGE